MLKLARIEEGRRAETLNRTRPSVTAGFTMPRDVDFCYFGHITVSGGEAYTRWLANIRDEILASARP
jgi:hypothetical protein